MNTRFMLIIYTYRGTQKPSDKLEAPLGMAENKWALVIGAPYIDNWFLGLP